MATPRSLTLAAALTVGTFGAAAATPLAATATTGTPATATPATISRVTSPQALATWPRDTQGRAKAIVRVGRASTLGAVRAALVGRGATVVEEFPALGAISVRIRPERLDEVRRVRGVDDVMADATVRSLAVDPLTGVEITATVVPLRVAEETIGATALWAQGITGRGVDVALIDTGVSPVPGLAGNLPSGSPKVLNGPDLSFDADLPTLRSFDAYGHGTHVAGIIAGRDDGWTPGDTTKFAGVAPDARIVNVKVGAANGATDVTQVIGGLEWVLRFGRSNGVNVRIVNLSFGTDSQLSWGEDPLSWAANILVANGFVVVAAAGNDGRNGELTSPAMNPNVIAVGAVDTAGTITRRDDTIAAYSSGKGQDRTVDFAAPGSHLLSLRVPGGYVDQLAAGSGRVGERFQAASGTSQATAVVSGAAALLVQRFPTASPLEIRAMLARTTRSLPGRQRSSGTGEIDVFAAVNGSRARWSTTDASTTTKRNNNSNTTTTTVVASTGSDNKSSDNKSSDKGDDSSRTTRRTRGAAPSSVQRAPTTTLPPATTASSNSNSNNTASADDTADVDDPTTGFATDADGAPDPGASTSRSNSRAARFAWPRGCDTACQGKGSLDLARGTRVPTYEGRPLVGNVFPNGNAWTGNGWTGNAWTASTWAGNAWSGNAWSGNAWMGNAWMGNAWSGNAWMGNAWSGNAWMGNAWSGNAWMGNAWSGNAWSGNAWMGNAWSGNAWSGIGWS